MRFSPAPAPVRAGAAWAAAALAWLGRQGTRAIAALVFIGIALPPVDALLRPYVTEAIFALLCIAFLRVDLAGLRALLARPGVVLAATLTTMLGIPLVFGGACLALGLPERAPDLFLGLMLQAVASPMMAAPAFAALMGLDSTPVLVTLVASTALVPVTAPLFLSGFAAGGLALTPLALGVRLFSILAGAAAVAAVLRRWVGRAALERHRDHIDGLNILVVYVFVAAVMQDVAARFLAAPGVMLGLAGVAFAVSLALLAVTALAFFWVGGERALALGMMTSQRNMGLMLAATGGALHDVVWIYFALCQFPIYLLPHLLKPIAVRITRPPAGQRAAEPD